MDSLMIPMKATRLLALRVQEALKVSTPKRVIM